MTSEELETIKRLFEQVTASTVESVQKEQLRGELIGYIPALITQVEAAESSIEVLEAHLKHVHGCDCQPPF